MKMKRAILCITVAFCLLTASLVALPFLISTQNIKRELDSGIMQMAAGKISYKGEPKLSFSPYLGVEVRNVVFADEKQEDAFNFLQIENLRFRIQLLPLVWGQTKFSDFRLIRPKFNFPANDEGIVNWTIIRKKINSLLKSRQGRDTGNYDNKTRSVIFDNTEWTAKPGRIEIVDGIIEARINDDDAIFRISNLNANASWPDVSSVWNVDGQAVWRGEIFKFSNMIENPLALFTSGKSNLKVDLDSPTLTASFDGQATMVSDIQLQGDTSVATPSLARLSELLLNDYSNLIFPIGSFRLKGSMSANAQEIRFTKSNIVLDDNAAIGNLQFHWFDKKTPKVSATLAFTSVDLTPLTEFISKKVMQTIDSNNKFFTRFPFDFDVRFSSRSYKIGKNNFGALAATAIINKDTWLFDIGEADFFGGKIVAAIASRTVDNINNIELKGVMRDFSMGDAMLNLRNNKILVTGKANVDFNLEISEESVSSIPKSVNGFFGNINVTLGQGEIEGVDLTKSLSILDQNKKFVTINELKGTTPFNNLSLDLLVYSGLGWITKGIIQGEESEFRFSGTTDLLSGGVAVYADIGKIEKNDSVSQRSYIFIGGTVKSPLLMRSPSSLDNPVNDFSGS